MGSSSASEDVQTLKLTCSIPYGSYILMLVEPVNVSEPDNTTR